MNPTWSRMIPAQEFQCYLNHLKTSQPVTIYKISNFYFVHNIQLLHTNINKLEYKTSSQLSNSMAENHTTCFAVGAIKSRDNWQNEQGHHGTATMIPIIIWDDSLLTTGSDIKHNIDNPSKLQSWFNRKTDQNTMVESLQSLSDQPYRYGNALNHIYYISSIYHDYELNNQHKHTVH